MSWLEVKYFERLKSNLEQYKQVSNNPFVVNFRCPLCGDSKHRKMKKRAYVYERGSSLMYYCHNCGASMAFFNFLEMFNPHLYKEYKLEWVRSQFGDTRKAPVENPFKTIVKFDKSLKLGTKLSDCSDDDCVLQYAMSRKLPSRFWGSLYSCSNIQTIISQIPKYENTVISPAAALVIPFFDENREFSYLSTRCIDPDSDFRYLVLEVDETRPKLWGLEMIDWSQKIYVFEGPIDAMCVPNSLALAGSVGIGAIDYILSRINKPCDVCFVYDNEVFSNNQIFKQVKKRIDEGFSTVLYDSHFPGKDVNEVICNDTMNYDSVNRYLAKRTFNGLNALLEIARLSKPHNR